jgi:hypothetical protein
MRGFAELMIFVAIFGASGILLVACIGLLRDKLIITDLGGTLVFGVVACSFLMIVCLYIIIVSILRIQGS